MSYHDRPWWSAATVLTALGLDVVVVDPEIEEHVTLWDECDGHGTITVLALDAAGWTLTVHEPEARVADVPPVNNRPDVGS